MPVQERVLHHVLNPGIIKQADRQRAPRNRGGKLSRENALFVNVGFAKCCVRGGGTF